MILVNIIKTTVLWCVSVVALLVIFPFVAVMVGFKEIPIDNEK